MKTKNNFNSISNELNAPKNCPGIKWKLKSAQAGGDGDFDLEIIPLLKLLNNSYWHTTASCAGHSLAHLKNPLEGYGIESPYRITIFIHVHKNEINRFVKIAEEFSAASPYIFWCELGYSDDYSNLVEKNYIPFRIVVFGRTKIKRDKILKRYEEIIKNNS